MARKWREIRRNGKLSEAELAEIDSEVDREVIQMNLRAVRDLVGKTQLELSEAADMAQGELSKIERRDDHLVSTLRRYIEALGGELDIIARFGDKSVRLRGV